MGTVKQYKYITPKVVKEGSIEIFFSEKESEKIKEVNEYNSYMNVCREKMQDLKKILHNYLIINYFTLVILFIVVFIGDIMLVQNKAFYIHLLISAILAVVYAAIGFVFTFWKKEKELIPNLLMSFTLLYIHRIYFVLIGINIFFYIMYNKKKGLLGEEIGYPIFREIEIDWIRGKKYDSRIKLPSDLKVEREL